MNKYIIAELNSQLSKDCKTITKYLIRENLTKSVINPYEFNVNSVKRIVTFKRLDYFSFIKKDFEIINPFGYFEFKYNTNSTHATFVNSYNAFEYMETEKGTIGTKLNTNVQFKLDKQEKLFVIAYMTKEIL